MLLIYHKLQGHLRSVDGDTKSSRLKNGPYSSKSLRFRFTKIRSRSLVVIRSKNLKHAPRSTQKGTFNKSLRNLKIFHYNIVQTKIKSKKLKTAL